MAFDLDAPTVFRVGEPTLGLPMMALDYRPGGGLGIAVPVPPADPEANRLARLESRVRLLEYTVVALRQAILDIEFPPPPPPWYARLATWIRTQWSALWRS